MRAVLPPELCEWHDRAAWVLEPELVGLFVIEDRVAEADFVLDAPDLFGDAAFGGRWLAVSRAPT